MAEATHEAHDAHAHAGDRNEVHHEPLPLSVYLGVAGALLALTAATVAVAQLDLGSFNLLVAMFIASIKASLVVLYFMNLRYDHDRLNRVVFLSALLFLAIYFTFTLADTLTRGDVDPVRGQYVPGSAAAGTATAAPAPAAGSAAPAGAAPAKPAH